MRDRYQIKDTNSQTKMKHQSKPEIILKAQIVKKIKIQNQNTAPPNQTKTVMQSNKK